VAARSRRRRRCCFIVGASGATGRRRRTLRSSPPPYEEHLATSRQRPVGGRRLVGPAVRAAPRIRLRRVGRTHVRLPRPAAVSARRPDRARHRAARDIGSSKSGARLSEPRWSTLPAVVDVRHFAAGPTRSRARFNRRPGRFMGRMRQRTRSASRSGGVVASITAWTRPTLRSTPRGSSRPPRSRRPATLSCSQGRGLAASLCSRGGLIEEAGFPGGRVKTRPGLGGDGRAALVRHPGVDKVSFTSARRSGLDIGFPSRANFSR